MFVSYVLKIGTRIFKDAAYFTIRHSVFNYQSETKETTIILLKTWTGLLATLLSVWKHWNADTVSRFSPVSNEDGHCPATSPYFFV